ncbi:hypothetical protein HPP92_022328 [Vanilla planifolia]|uniref:Uncharacterized protein n=1 Tax=Vanilla planifolia TaxID=51239 RepID=A0A835PS07_VANPL|nr:hypothetical protein HPP92_022638 [Vanilla planifolia]KAG0459200.1 hypothetical protein HPP92_022328 [Vanilla planifolia]
MPLGPFVLAVTAGQETYLLVGLHNEGGSALNVIAIKASLMFLMITVCLCKTTVQEFYNASVPYLLKQHFLYTLLMFFYNGTVEIIEASGFLTIESVFSPITLGVALIATSLFWGHMVVYNSCPRMNAWALRLGMRRQEAIHGGGNFEARVETLGKEEWLLVDGRETCQGGSGLVLNGKGGEFLGKKGLERNRKGLYHGKKDQALKGWREVEEAKVTPTYAADENRSLSSRRQEPIGRRLLAPPSLHGLFDAIKMAVA